jgi:hypothetical protein
LRVPDTVKALGRGRKNARRVHRAVLALLEEELEVIRRDRNLKEETLPWQTRRGP